MGEAKATKIHWRMLSKELNELRVNDYLTDFSICVGEEIIRAHKIILAANSDFFKAMFNNDSSEVRDGLVTLKEVDFEAVEVIVEFWYTGYTGVSDKNICSLLLAASRFQSKTALEICSEFAGAILTPDNCLSIALLCERCNFDELGEKAFVYCLENFDCIHRTSDLLCLDQEFFTKIISDDRLDAKNEIDVFEAIVNWVLFDESVRSSQLDVLMRKVRLLSIDFESMIKSLVTKSDSISEPWRVKVISILALSQNKSALCEQYAGTFNMKPRRPVSASKQRLYVFGGLNLIEGKWEKVKDCEVYDPSTDTWSHLPAMEKPIQQDLVVACPEWDFIYAPSSDGRTFQYYNLDANRWLSGYRHVFHRPKSALLIALGENIYSFDGIFSDGDFVMFETLFKYDLKGALTTCKSFSTPRKKCGFAVHDHYIYMAGGLIGSQASKLVQRYDSINDIWEPVARMINPRYSFGICSYDDKIYVAGGSYSQDGKTRISRTAEVYDIKLNTWTEIAYMIDFRSSFRLVELLGQIYAVGGMHRDDTLSQVEAYDPESKKWIKKKPLLRKRCNAAAIVTRKGR